MLQAPLFTTTFRGDEYPLFERDANPDDYVYNNDSESDNEHQLTSVNNEIAKAASLSEKANGKVKAKDTCDKCHRPFVYDHITWCRGQMDGYTCQCNRKKLSPIEERQVPFTNFDIDQKLTTLQCTKRSTSTETSQESLSSSALYKKLMYSLVNSLNQLAFSADQ